MVMNSYINAFKPFKSSLLVKDVQLHHVLFSCGEAAVQKWPIFGDMNCKSLCQYDNYIRVVQEEKGEVVSSCLAY